MHHLPAVEGDGPVLAVAATGGDAAHIYAQLDRRRTRGWFDQGCLRLLGQEISTEAEARRVALGIVQTLDLIFDQEARKALVSNRLGWEVIRMILVYRHRWTGTETFHRDGKQQLGLGDCQVRSGEGQTRHVYLVSTAYSLLMRSLGQSRVQDWGTHLRRDTVISQWLQASKAAAASEGHVVHS